MRVDDFGCNLEVLKFNTLPHPKIQIIKAGLHHNLNRKSLGDLDTIL